MISLLEVQFSEREHARARESTRERESTRGHAREKRRARECERENERVGGKESDKERKRKHKKDRARKSLREKHHPFACQPLHVATGKRCSQQVVRVVFFFQMWGCLLIVNLKQEEQKI